MKRYTRSSRKNNIRQGSNFTEALNNKGEFDNSEELDHTTELFMTGQEGFFDKEKLHINLARLRKGGEKFEIDINPDKAMAFKQGADIDIRDVLKVEKIFVDAKKGMLASEKLMQQLFSTSDPIEVAKLIIKGGEIQLTEEFRNKSREQKMKKVMEIIHRNGIDPRTNLPHPMTRIENAFEEARIHLDEYKAAEAQVEDVLKKLRPILPIKFAMKEIAVRIPPDYAAKSYALVKGFGRILNEDWLTDGSWSFVIEMPGGMESEFYDKLNSFTHGNNDAKVLKIR